jgi:hypothetical protein
VRSRDDAAPGDGDGDGGDGWPGDELSRTTLTWGDHTDLPVAKASLSLVDVPGTLSVELWADTAFVSPADMTALLRRVESVLIDAVPAAPAAPAISVAKERGGK